jgi:hypothetical protein
MGARFLYRRANEQRVPLPGLQAGIANGNSGHIHRSSLPLMNWWSTAQWLSVHHALAYSAPGFAVLVSLHSVIGWSVRTLLSISQSMPCAKTKRPCCTSDPVLERHMDYRRVNQP